ncbi:MAG: hypothetical protein GY898_10455 [Proteobacteria bacterium]|nr:hypothetical protein [Pseudomonadota bacterium]
MRNWMTWGVLICLLAPAAAFAEYDEFEDADERNAPEPATPDDTIDIAAVVGWFEQPRSSEAGLQYLTGLHQNAEPVDQDRYARALQVFLALDANGQDDPALRTLLLTGALDRDPARWKAALEGGSNLTEPPPLTEDEIARIRQWEEQSVLVVFDSEGSMTAGAMGWVVASLYLNPMVALAGAGRDLGQDWHFRLGGKKVSWKKALRATGDEHLIGTELTWGDARAASRDHNHRVLESLGLTSHHLQRYVRELEAKN